MNRFACLVVGLVFSLSAISTIALAAPSCTGWMKQNDGSYWRTCVDDKGR